MAGQLGNIRKGLQDFWTKDKISELKSAYKNTETKAYDGGKYATCLQQAFDSGQAGPDAYRKCAKEAGLAKALHELWSSQ